MDSMTRSRDENSLVGLVSGLREDVHILIHKEIELAKTEVSEKLAAFKRNAVFLGIGGVIAYLGLIFLLLSLGFLVASGFESLGLSTGIALFLGFLAIAIVAIALGGILVGKALNAFSKQSMVPEKTLNTLKEIKEGGLEQVSVPIKSYQTEPQPEISRTSDQVKADVERTRKRIGREVRGIKTRLQVAQIAASFVATI